MFSGRSDPLKRSLLITITGAIVVYVLFAGIRNLLNIRGALPPMQENRPPFIATDQVADTISLRSGGTGEMLIVGGDRESMHVQNGILETLPVSIATLIPNVFLSSDLRNAYFGSTMIPVRVQKLSVAGLSSVGTSLVHVSTSDGTYTSTGTVKIHIDPWPSIGVNIDFNVDYATMMPWVDLMHLWRGWGSTATPWSTDPSIPMTSDGYPLEDAGVFSYFDGYPNGTYHMKWDGEGTVSFQGATLQNLQKIGNTTTADLIFNRSSTSNGIMMRITGINAANPVHSMRIIMPEYDVNTTQVYQNDFIAHLRPFSVIRMMDPLSTNGNPQVEWNDRTKPEDAIYTSNKGMPYEIAAELGNAVHRDIWVCIPALASDDFVHGMARTIHDHLDPSLNVYVEYSNEVWNGIFPQYQQVIHASLDNPLIPTGDDFTRAGKQTAYKLKVFSDIFREEFGADASRVRPVLAGQVANTYFTNVGLQFIHDTYGSPSNYFYAIASAPYISLDSNIDLPGLTMDQLFDAMRNKLNTDIHAWLVSWNTLAQQYNLYHVSYEGGQHLVAFNYNTGSNVNEQLKLDAQNDPRMGQLINDLVQMWGDLGGNFFTHYSFVGTHGQWGSWGMLEHLYDPGSPRWDALMRRLLPAGDATFDGFVHYDDFVVVRDHFGRTEMWWSQGDFNGDRKVDSNDLTLLRLQIQDLSPAQRQEVDAFGS